MNMSLEDMFWKVWNSLTELEQEYLVANSEVSYKVEVKGLEKIEPFKAGKITFSDVLEILVNEVTVEVV